MAAISSFLLFPFFLVTLHDPNYKDGEGVFKTTLLMVWFMCVPTLLATIRFPNRNNLDVANDVLFVGSLLVPWMFRWLPSATCSLSKDTSFPISHIVILNLTIFLVHVPSRLHHRMGFNFLSIFEVEKLVYAMVGFLFCFVVVMPLGVFSGFLDLVLNDQQILLDYLSFFFLQYFLYSMILEIFFRGIVQNLIEFHLEKRYPCVGKEREENDNIIHLQAFAPLSEDATDLLTDLDEINSPTPSFSSQLGEFFGLNRNALIALFSTSVINGLCFLISPFCMNLNKEVVSDAGDMASDGELNFMYGFLSFLLAISYGWVWRKTTRVTVSALTHAMVNFVWFNLFPCAIADK